MKCPICGLEGFISGSRITVCGDNSADEETEVFDTLTYICRNPGCESHMQEIGENQVQIYSGIEKND